MRKIIQYLIAEGTLIRSEVDSAEGEKLYTTRRHYERKATLWERFKAALRNRAE